MQDESTGSDVRAPLITEIEGLLSQVARRFEPGENEMRDWIIANFKHPDLADLLNDMTIMMLRVLGAVGQLEPVNGITISKQARIPKGSVSKITRRLTARGLMTQEHLPDNKKEILFRLTPTGKALNDAHQAFDRQMERGFIAFMQKYSPDEIRFLIRVLQDVVDASFLDAGKSSS